MVIIGALCTSIHQQTLWIDISVCLCVVPERFSLSSAWTTSARQAQAVRKRTVQENLQMKIETKTVSNLNDNFWDLMYIKFATKKKYILLSWGRFKRTQKTVCMAYNILQLTTFYCLVNVSLLYWYFKKLCSRVVCLLKMGYLYLVGEI